MKVLAINCGSSSIKYLLYDWKDQKTLVKGVVERIGQEMSVVKFQTDNIKDSYDRVVKDHLVGFEQIIDIITNPANEIIQDIKAISAVGHRVVHGADKFTKSVIIDDEVLKTIKDVAFLAPLHNPPNIIGIESAMKILPDVKQIAIFDTAFHQTMPEHAYMYAVPYSWYTKHKVRKYGFHGTSHLYVSKMAAKVLGKKTNETSVITMHIGNGVSHCAIKNGVSIDTSMGFTPLDGSIMGTRSGAIDPAIITYIMEKENLSAQEVENILNKQSGLVGITGKYSDRRDVTRYAMEGDSMCKLALELECYRLKQYIGSYTAVLGGTDAIVFTAGVGENNPLIREKACEGLEYMGIKIDKEKNDKVYGGPEEPVLISTEDSKIKVYVIPTDEEIVMIEDTVALIEGRYDDHIKMTYKFQK